MDHDKKEQRSYEKQYGSDWQWITQYYWSNGKRRKHRKKVYDVCPICGGAKRVRAFKCRECYENRKNQEVQDEGESVG